MEILKKIVKPQFLPHLSDWSLHSTPSQLQGLHLIQQIYNSKGTKPLSRPPPPQHSLHQTHSSFMAQDFNRTLQQSQEYFRRKQLTTSYQFHHSSKKPPAATILDFKKLQETELGSALTQMTVLFIDAWLLLGQNEQYQQLVLQCLRSIKSAIDAHRKKISEMKSKYQGQQDWTLVKPIRMDKVGEQYQQYKPNHKAIKAQEAKHTLLKSKLEDYEKSQFAKLLGIYKHFKIN